MSGASGPVLAPEGPLETFAKTAAGDARLARYEARETLRAFSDRKRVRSCGAALIGGSDLVLRVTVGAESTAAGWVGFEHCGSVWACPVCSAKIAAHRQADLAVAVERHEARGGGLGMLTVTMRHRKGQKLADLWDDLSRAWRRFVSSRAYKTLVKGAGVVGYLRATEVTHGQHGWHVHLHVLYFLAAPLAVNPTRTAKGNLRDDASSALRNQLSALWVKSVRGVGRTADDKGQDFKVFRGSGEALLAGAQYVIKTTYTPTSAAAELTRHDYKTGRKASRTPFEIARQLVELMRDTGEIDSADLALWEEYERASVNRRQLIWSRGLRAELGLDVELTDQEVAELALDGFDVLRVTGASRRRLGSDGTTQAVCLGIAERAQTWLDARHDVGAYLTARGYEWEPVHVA